jgi:hypothetical protein
LANSMAKDDAVGFLPAVPQDARARREVPGVQH